MAANDFSTPKTLYNSYIPISAMHKVENNSLNFVAAFGE